MSISLDQDPRHRRRTTGCLTCRRRRVKCDEVRPRCRQCIRMERVCSWQGDRFDIVRAAGVEGGVIDEHSSSIVSQAASSKNFEAEIERNDQLPKRHEPVRAGKSLRPILRLVYQGRYRSSIHTILNSKCLLDRNLVRQKLRLKICSNCRTDRVRCSQDRPSCVRCLEKKTLCQYPDSDVTGSNLDSTSTSTSILNSNSNLNSGSNVDFQVELDHLRRDDASGAARSRADGLGYEHQDESRRAIVGVFRDQDCLGMNEHARM